MLTAPSVVGVSWKSLHNATAAFVGPSDRFDFRRLRVLLVGSGRDPVNVDPLLQLGHESSEVLLAGIQDLAQSRAGPQGFLIRAPSFGKKRKVFSERTSVLGALVHRFCVRLHGWWQQWLVMIFGKNLLGNNCGIPFLERLNQRVAERRQVRSLLRGEIGLRAHSIILIFPHSLHSFTSSLLLTGRREVCIMYWLAKKSQTSGPDGALPF